jgi:hypothetical protein
LHQKWRGNGHMDSKIRANSWRPKKIIEQSLRSTNNQLLEMPTRLIILQGTAKPVQVVLKQLFLLQPQLF